ncbi:MAG: hypothetical protein WC827_04620 [Candidatus Paceibacterota bacterium]|jgi:hypothetical protein
MNEDFVKFATYVLIFIIVGLFLESSKSDAANKKNTYLENKNKIQTQQYRQGGDFYRGVPVEVKRGEY